MDEFEINYNRALRFLSYRPRSEKEIRDYFSKNNKQRLIINKQETRANVKEETINAIVKKLKEYKFINDEEFAKIWIKQRTKIKPRAWRVIQYELKQKGISDEIIKGLQFSEEENDQDLDLESAKILVQRKLKRYGSLPKYEQREKIGRFLAGKGFNWNTIKKVIDEINK
jgi:regulatory protein